MKNPVYFPALGALKKILVNVNRNRCYFGVGGERVSGLAKMSFACPRVIQVVSIASTQIHVQIVNITTTAMTMMTGPHEAANGKTKDVNFIRMTNF